MVATGHFMSVNIYHGTIYAPCVDTDDVIEGRAYVYKKVWTLATTYHLHFKASSAATKPVVTVRQREEQPAEVVSTNDASRRGRLTSGERSPALAFATISPAVCC